jgi:hypothetical protein
MGLIEECRENVGGLLPPVRFGKQFLDNVHATTG